MTRTTASEIAYAKVNLALHVRDRRADGYHTLETVFAFCQDGDLITATLSDQTTLSISGPFASGLSTSDNLIIRAANAIGVNAHIALVKNLPVASGIGGGSADAAATLRLLSQLTDTPIPDANVLLSLGADIAPCVISQTVRGEGIGIDLTPEHSVAGCPILLVNPGVPLSTRDVFAGWDGMDRGPLGYWRDGRNDLEAPAKRVVPVIGDVLDWLLSCSGANFVRMSGSGATCFALFDTSTQCHAAAKNGRNERSNWWFMPTVLR